MILRVCAKIHTRLTFIRYVGTDKNITSCKLQKFLVFEDVVFNVNIESWSMCFLGSCSTNKCKGKSQATIKLCIQTLHLNCHMSQNNWVVDSHL